MNDGPRTLSISVIKVVANGKSRVVFTVGYVHRKGLLLSVSKKGENRERLKGQYKRINVQSWILIKETHIQTLQIYIFISISIIIKIQLILHSRDFHSRDRRNNDVGLWILYDLFINILLNPVRVICKSLAVSD